MRHIVERRRPHRRVLVAFHWMIIRIIGPWPPVGEHSFLFRQARPARAGGLMRAPQSNPRSPHDVATARMYQRRTQLGLPRREACASARILKFSTQY